MPPGTGLLAVCRGHCIWKASGQLRQSSAPGARSIRRRCRISSKIPSAGSAIPPTRGCWNLSPSISAETQSTGAFRRGQMPNSGCLGIYLCFFGQEELDTHYLHGAGKILFAGRYHHKIADFDGAILGDIVVGFAAVFKAHAAIGQLPFAAAKPVVNREGENVAGAVKLNKVVQVFDDCSKILRQPVFCHSCRKSAGRSRPGGRYAADRRRCGGMLH